MKGEPMANKGDWKTYFAANIILSMGIDKNLKSVIRLSAVVYFSLIFIRLHE